MINIIKKFIKKNKLIYKLVLNLYTLGYNTYYTLYYSLFLSLFSIFKIDDKKIIIINRDGMGYGDSGKYICNKLFKYKYKIYWAVKEEYKNSLPKTINSVKYNSLIYLYHLATSKIWINNARFIYGIKKRKDQFYIQTWHGCFALKKVEAGAENVLPKHYILGAKNDSKMANLFISNSTFCTNFYKKYFWFNGDILEYGCPRNDIIVNNNKILIEKVKKYFKISNSEKICLYAPTFRVDASLKPYNINYETLVNELKNRFKGKRKILIRLHPNIIILNKQLSYLNEYIINASEYPDIQELLVASDFMITDYSSCIFDYAISGKPAIIYASDINDYTKDRNFEIKLEDTPFPIATNNDELKKVLNEYDIKKYKDKLNKFYNDMGLKETGKSCEKIVEIINKQR